MTLRSDFLENLRVKHDVIFPNHEMAKISSDDTMKFSRESEHNVGSYSPVFRKAQLNVATNVRYLHSLSLLSP